MLVGSSRADRTPAAGTPVLAFRFSLQYSHAGCAGGETLAWRLGQGVKFDFECSMLGQNQSYSFSIFAVQIHAIRFTGDHCVW